MKVIRHIQLLPIILCLTVVTMADAGKKGEVRFSDHVMVSGTQLEPGNYVVRWNGSGPGVQIRFLRDGKEVTSVIGNVVQEKNVRKSFTTDSGENGSRVLTKIAFSDASLVLVPGETSTSQ